MRIRVPVEMLNDASSRLSNMEIQIAQNGNTLNNVWGDLRLEAKSRAAVESRVNQVRTMAGRLSSETSSLSKYLILVKERFIEADRKEGMIIAKTGNEYLSFVGQNGDKNSDAYYDINKKFATLALINPMLATSLLAVPVGIVGLKWVGDTTYKHGHKWWMPGEAGAAKNVADNIISGAGATKIAGDLTVDIAFLKASGLVTGAIIGKATFVAIGLTLVGAASPLIIGVGLCTVAVGTFFGVSYLFSQLREVSIGGNTVDGMAKDVMEYNYNLASERISSAVGHAKQAASVGYQIGSAGVQNIGQAVKGFGQIAIGLGQKIFSK